MYVWQLGPADRSYLLADTPTQPASSSTSSSPSSHSSASSPSHHGTAAAAGARSSLPRCAPLNPVVAHRPVPFVSNPVSRQARRLGLLVPGMPGYALERERLLQMQLSGISNASGKPEIWDVYDERAGAGGLGDLVGRRLRRPSSSCTKLRLPVRRTETHLDPAHPRPGAHAHAPLSALRPPPLSE